MSRIFLIFALSCFVFISSDACKYKCKDCGKFFGGLSDCTTIIQHPTYAPMAFMPCNREIYDPYWSCGSCKPYGYPYGSSCYKNKPCGCNGPCGCKSYYNPITYGYY